MKNRSYINLSTSKTVWLISLALLVLGCSNTNKELQQTQTKVVVNTPEADKDWEALKKSSPMFPTKEAYEAYKTLPRLELKRFEDNHSQQKMKLAELFWDRYPEDTRRDTARSIFIATNPYFIPGKLQDSVQHVLAAIPRKNWLRFMRVLPVENKAMEQWLQKGDAMVAEALASDRPIKDKESAEWQLFGRDFVRSARYFGLLPKETKDQEADYWKLVDTQYWESLRLRLDAHITKYADLPVLADRAKDFLSGLKAYAPSVAETYWQEIFQKYGDNDKVGVKALHETAKEQLDALIVERGNVPVNIKFTALDGRKVDIAEMRGKVVLVDFWASWCAPCIAEVPHLKAMYKKYHDQGFNVIGICLDEAAAAERVKSIITNKEIPWPQRFEGKGFGGDTYRQLYGIGSLPTVWLVDKDGKIVDRNARGERLEPLIRKYLGLDKL
ncbi:TlpA family protein disulfide reductase [bacterium AH-315-A23]|nr:TlpA family protein disulfide reductase [bacterium AH-315-A23]